MPTEGLPAVKVGDNLLWETGNPYRGDEPVTVSRVGRTWLYVTLHGRELRERFDRKTGLEEGQRAIRSRLLTQKQHEERAHRRSLLAKLRAAGLELKPSAGASMSTDKLRALLAVVQDDDVETPTS
ncbi:hypothetical protein [Streptomyces noursei]|uniref:beta barrel domain-containing protein n=1 Tax=Streptomyces noursei TaxID=1971 RepID=UPI00381CF7F3